MGLDLLIYLENSYDFKEKYAIQDEDFEINESSVSLYYRLNWSGVAYEYQYSTFFLPFKYENETNKEKALIDFKDIQADKGYLIETPNRIFVVEGKNITIQDNTILNIYYRYDNHKVLTYKIYDLDILDLYDSFSVVEALSFFSWTGSNGDAFILKHSDNGGLIVDEICYDYDENDELLIETYKQLKKISRGEAKKFFEIIENLDDLLEKEDEYVAEKNRILIKMLLEFKNDQFKRIFTTYG